MKLIVGLGNPGQEYENTRHNVGFSVIDHYLGNVSWQEKFQALYYKLQKNGEVIYFIKPQTFMNESGRSVGKFYHYFNLAPEDILIIQDDLDEAIGQYKLKKNSSAGGHNGIKSIIAALNTDTFLRLKVGINSLNRHDTIDFVLGKFSHQEEELLKQNLVTFDKIIDSFIENGIERTMNIYNTK